MKNAEERLLAMVGTTVRGQEILAYYRDRKNNRKFSVKCKCGTIDEILCTRIVAMSCLRNKCKACSIADYKATFKYKVVTDRKFVVDISDSTC